MNALAARRRHPAAIALLILVGLLVTGGAYAFLAPKDANAATSVSADAVADGKNLFLANCASCHGTNAQGSSAGPSLVGVGAAAVDFQVGTGPYAARRAQRPGPAQRHGQDQVRRDRDLGARGIRRLARCRPGHPGCRVHHPLVPGSQVENGQTLTNSQRIARGGEIFRVNCAMCHNFAGAGGALTRGKYAPSLTGVTGTHIYEAMVTGPQSMPVFNDQNITPESKQDVISYLNAINKQTNVGGMTLGNLGPVSEGMFVWVFALEHPHRDLRLAREEGRMSARHQPPADPTDDRTPN